MAAHHLVQQGGLWVPAGRRRSPRHGLVRASPLSRWAAGGFVPGRAGHSRAVGRGAGRAVARIAYALGIRRQIALGNLAAAFPERPEAERRAIARAAYANMARVVVDALRTLGAPREVSGWPRSGWTTSARWSTRSPGAAACLVATAHLGSWELFGAAMAQRVPLNAVVRPLSGGLNARLVEARERAGLRLIPGRGALSGTVAALRRNEVVAMLVDQAIGGKHALFVPFFGRPAATTAALSMAALRTGAPTLVVVALPEAGRLRFRVEGPFEGESSGDRGQDLLAHTGAVTAALERIIRDAPEQWLWLHRRWKLLPPPASNRRLTDVPPRPGVSAMPARHKLARVTTETAVPSVAPLQERLLACRDCGLEQTLPPLRLHTIARCVRCGGVLDVREPPDSTPLALALAGAVFAVLSNCFPVIEVRLAGREQAELLFTGARALSADGYGVLGAVVACFSIVIPLLWLLLVAWVLFQIRQGEKPPLLGPGFRLAERLRPWAMTEVFVVGAFVAYTRLQDFGSNSVSVGIGGAAVAATAFFTFLVDRTLDRRHVWDSIASPELAREGSSPDLAVRPAISSPTSRRGPAVRAAGRCSGAGSASA